MGKGLKLTNEEKEVFENIKWFIKNKIEWLGPVKDRELDPMLKDLIKSNGTYAVFSINDPDVYDEAKNLIHMTDRNRDENRFDSLIVVESVDEAKNLIKWNPSTHTLVIDAKWMDFVYEVREPYGPHFFRLSETKGNK